MQDLALFPFFINHTKNSPFRNNVRDIPDRFFFFFSLGHLPLGSRDEVLALQNISKPVSVPIQSHPPSQKLSRLSAKENPEKWMA